MKSYTDIEQSRKLAEFMPIESADMWWPYYYDIISDTGEYDKEPMLHKPVCGPDKALPCWSLAALFEGVLPLEVETHKQTDGHKIYYYVEAYIPPRRNKGKEIYLSTVRHENLVDACIEMIFTLKQRNLLQC